jgi:uncharacterized protein
MHYLKYVRMLNKKLAIIFSIYFLMVMSKRLVLPSLEGYVFWLVDVIYFVVLPSLLMYKARASINIFEILKIDKDSMDFHFYGTLFFQSLVCLIGIYVFDAVGRRLGFAFQSTYPDFLSSKLNYSSHLPKIGMYKFFLVIYFSITAAVVEEFFSRVMVKEILVSQKINSNLLFVITSSILFGLIHWAGGSFSIVSTGVIGVCLAVSYVWTKDIRPVVVAHFMFDFFYFI